MRSGASESETCESRLRNSGNRHVGTRIPYRFLDRSREQSRILRAADQEEDTVRRVISSTADITMLTGASRIELLRASATIPTTVSRSSPRVNCRPRASWFGHAARAVASEMTRSQHAVVHVERAPFEHALLERGEIIRADPPVVGKRLRLRLIRAVNAVDPALSLQHDRAHERRRLNSRQLTQALQRIVVKLALSGHPRKSGPAGLRSPQRHDRWQSPCPYSKEMQASAKQRGYQQERCAGKHLCPDQPAAQQVTGS